MTLKFHIHIILVFVFIYQSCSQSPAKNAEELGKQKFVAESNPVEVIILEEKIFNKELLSNGKLKAYKKCELQFEVSQRLERISVKNGDKISKGTKIAILNRINAEQKYQQAQIQYHKAELDRKELLISQGHNPESLDSIPKKILEVANIRSGYSVAENSLNEAKTTLQKHQLISPISGKVANLNSKIYEFPEAGKAFCMIIDDSKFEVEFSVLETELRDVTKGQAVDVQPFSLYETFTGHISEINPMIDDNGMVKIKALISNANGKLMEGMNVEVRVKKKVADQLVVPKLAVVIRQDKEVLFTVKAGKAYWTYVHTTHSNKTHHTVIANKDRGATLAAGDTVIISNNLNLAHDSQIKIESQF